MLTDAVKLRILNNIAGINSTNLQTGYWLGLSSTTPTVAGGNFTEPSSDAGYRRVYIYSSSSTSQYVQYPFIIDPNDSHSAINRDEVHFNVATADWGDPLTYVGIFDNSAGSGTLLAYGLLVDGEGDPAPITVLKDHIPTILAGQARITIDVE